MHVSLPCLLTDVWLLFASRVELDMMPRGRKQLSAVSLAKFQVLQLTVCLCRPLTATRSPATAIFGLRGPRWRHPWPGKQLLGPCGQAITVKCHRSRSTPTEGWVSPPLTHTHTHTHHHTAACGHILCGPGMHICCLWAACGLLGCCWVLLECVELLWTLGAGTQ